MLSVTVRPGAVMEGDKSKKRRRDDLTPTSSHASAPCSGTDIASHLRLLSREPSTKAFQLSWCGNVHDLSKYYFELDLGHDVVLWTCYYSSIRAACRINNTGRSFFEADSTYVSALADIFRATQQSKQTKFPPRCSIFGVVIPPPSQDSGMLLMPRAVIAVVLLFEPLQAVVVIRGQHLLDSWSTKFWRHVDKFTESDALEKINFNCGSQFSFLRNPLLWTSFVHGEYCKYCFVF